MKRLLAPIVLVVIVAISTAANAGDAFRYPEGKHGKGELRYVRGIPLLRVEGTDQEIGEQIGVLALKPGASLVRERDNLLKGEGWYLIFQFAAKAASSVLPKIPADHLTQLDAAAKASGWPRELLVFGNTLPDLMKGNLCSSLMVEPQRSTTGQPLFGRNLDWGAKFPLEQYTLVTVYRPQGKHAFASVAFLGMLGCVSGINDAGLSLAEHYVGGARDGSPSLDVSGVPFTFVLRRILEECATVEDAERLLRSLRHTTTNNFAVCDRRHAVVFEVTPRHVVVRHAEDSLCACTNHFRTQELSLGMDCPRYAILDTSRRMKKLSLDDVLEKLDAVANETTLQTMIFEPVSLKLHLAFGLGPASQLPLHELELSELFTTGQFPTDRGLADGDRPPVPPQTRKNKKGLYDVEFCYRPVGHAAAVYLAGTFNNWKPAAWKMAGPDKLGFYRTSIELRQGRYEYKFVIDGKTWRRDPANDVQVGYYRNSVLDVGR